MSQRRTDRGPIAPKPFDYIPFADRALKAPPAGHHRFDPKLLTGHLTGEIEVLTPLHVGAGVIELTERVASRTLVRQSPLVKAFVRSGGVRVIPGSSLKGAVRSVVEAITPSTVGKVGRRTRVPGGLQEPQKLSKEKAPAHNPLSPADRLFGVMDYLGQVGFDDARQIGSEVTLVQVPSLYAPRQWGSVRGRKFYKHGRPAAGNTPTEAVPAGGRFSFRCDFENLSAAELGVLLIALAQGDPPLHLKLGGGKPACYGSVAFREVGLWLRPVQESYLTWEDADREAEPGAYVQAAQADGRLLLQEQLRALAETLRYPNDRECPEGNY